MLRSAVPLCAALCLLGCKKSETSSGPGAACTPGILTCGGTTTCDANASICSCPTGNQLCSAGTCTDITLDANNCGGCGLVCPGATACTAGRCGAGCAQGATDCSGTCADLQSNASNCGACGKACGDGEFCRAGQCMKQQCAYGLVWCPGYDCQNLASSPVSCGACGVQCGPDLVCNRGVCGNACDAGLNKCTGGACADFKHDSGNCGACGTVCKAEEVCALAGDVVKCVKYTLAPCNTCPCAGCGGRSCCAITAQTGQVSALCLDGACPAP